MKTRRLAFLDTRHVTDVRVADQVFDALSTPTLERRILHMVSGQTNVRRLRRPIRADFVDCHFVDGVTIPRAPESLASRNQFVFFRCYFGAGDDESSRAWREKMLPRLFAPEHRRIGT